MYSGSKYRGLYNTFLFRWLKPSFDHFCPRNMSINIEPNVGNDQNDICINNKRQLNDENDEIAAKMMKTEDKQRIKKKHYAILMGYLGRGYFGMQRNPGMKTIEEDLANALYKANLINDESLENMRNIKFQRAARTDKGVSAARQIVNLRLPEDATKESINQHLPNEIRVFGMKRVTKGFNSKNQCDARTYKYVIPTYAFAPEEPSFFEETNEDIPKEERYKQRLEQLQTIDGKPFDSFRITPELQNKVNSITKALEGTHNFHNYTSKTKPLDPRAKRYIMEFSCNETFIANGREFAIFEVKGQSFMLHQIRKMVSIVVGITRNIATEDIINEMFKHEKYIVPTAPSLGLFLEYVHYSYYNKRYGSDGMHEALSWVECEDEVNEFRKDFILKHIVDTEVAENTTLDWLAGLDNRHLLLREEVYGIE